MAAIYRKMYYRKLPLTCCIAVTISLLAAYAAFAQGRTVTMKCKKVLHDTQAKKIEAGITPKHVLWICESKGLVIFENNQLASLTLWYLWDDTVKNGKEQGAGHGYGIYTFADGSTMTYKFESNTPNHKIKTFYYDLKGTSVITEGTGRYKGIKGTGTYTAKVISPGDEIFVEETLTYTLP